MRAEVSDTTEVMNGSLSTRFGVHDDNPISRINVKPRSTGVLTSMLSRDGPPDELYLKTANMDVGIEEYQNKTWVYDFRQGSKLIQISTHMEHIWPFGVNKGVKIRQHLNYCV